MSKRMLPSHVPYTARAWRKRKRAEWRAVIKALERYALGCAFTPSYGDIDQMFEVAQHIRRSLRGNWRIR